VLRSGWVPHLLFVQACWDSNGVIPILSVAHHLLGVMMQGKITEAEAPTIWLDATPLELSVPPPPSSPHFMPDAFPAATVTIYPGLGRAPNNAGLHTRWLGYPVVWFYNTSRTN